MKRSIIFSAMAVSALGLAKADLYYIPNETQESIPLKWSLGVDVVWDDNVNPTVVGVGSNEDLLSLNPYVGLTFVSLTPQSTLDVYARLGGVYYFDKPSAAGSDDFYSQVRAGVNYTYRVSERLRFSSRNFISYDLEPNYSYGVASSRQLGEYLYWETDNSIGYRWTERFATYTGFSLSGLDYDKVVTDQDRFTWSIYNQFRYQLSPQTVLTGDYRYSQTEGDRFASDSTSHYILGGVEHRFSPNTILILRAGAQIYEPDAAGASDSTSPYLEATVRTAVNEQFAVRAFARYGIENYDTVRTVGGSRYNFDERQTLRLGVSGTYTVSQALSVHGGLDYIPASFKEGRRVSGAGPLTVSGLDEDLINAYVGLTLKFTDTLYGSLTYNYTDSDSDFAGRSYDRNRVSVGVRAEF